MKKIIITQQRFNFPNERRGYKLEEEVIEFIKQEVPFSEELEEYGDYEDFYENYLRLYYVAKLYPKELIIINDRRRYYNYETKQVLTSDEVKTLLAEPHFKYGMLNKLENAEEDLIVGSYASSPSFQKYSNRYAKVLGFPAEEENYENMEIIINKNGSFIKTKETSNVPKITSEHDNAYILKDEANGLIQIKKLRNKGINKFVLKDGRAKHGLYKIDLEGVPNTDEGFINHMRKYFLLTENDWAILNLFRTLPSHLVQEFKQMKYEYRFFVYNSVLISGAGCVEEHTPLVNTKQFNTLMEAYRNETVIEDCPQIVERYIEVAKQIVSLTNATEPKVKNYSLDLCLYEDDTIGMIERNPFSNSGLYAQDLESIVKAVLAANNK